MGANRGVSAFIIWFEPAPIHANTFLVGIGMNLSGLTTDPEVTGCPDHEFCSMLAGEVVSFVGGRMNDSRMTGSRA